MGSTYALQQRLARHVAVFRIVFGLIWAVDASFKWRPQFMHSYLQQVQAAAQGQPSWLQWLFATAEHVLARDPQAFAVATALIESVTALGLVLGFARRTGYVVGAIFSLMVWALAEGFGGPYTAGSTDIGTGIIYAIVFAALYGLDRLTGPSPWSLDGVIERHRSRWHRVAESRYE